MDYTSFVTPDKSSCEACHKQAKNVGLATAYIPMQELDQVYPIQEALVKGTAFPELYEPKH